MSFNGWRIALDSPEKSLTSLIEHRMNISNKQKDKDSYVVGVKPTSSFMPAILAARMYSLNLKK